MRHSYFATPITAKPGGLLKKRILQTLSAVYVAEGCFSLIASA
jgi:hypothetical protein